MSATLSADHINAKPNVMNFHFDFWKVSKSYGLDKDILLRMRVPVLASFD